jgi:transcriptional regulator with XRE-family HTH domain
MTQKANFTAKQLERMKDMRANGFTDRDIARVFGVHSSTIGAYLRGERPVKG